MEKVTERNKKILKGNTKKMEIKTTKRVGEGRRVTKKE